MRRILVLSVALLPFATACNQNAEPTARTEEPYTPVSTSSSGSTYGSTYNSSPTYTSSRSGGSLDALDAPPTTPGNVPVTVQPTYGGSDTTYTSTGSTYGGDESLTPAGGGRVHLVRKGDTLYKLARDYYGQDARWRDIYSANQTRLGNPNQLPVGMKLIIP